MVWVNVDTKKSYSSLVLILVLMIFVSGIAVVLMVNKSRDLFNVYYRLKSFEQKHQDEYARLLIESSSEGAVHKILNSSQKYLKMHIPKVSNRLYLP